MNNGPLDHKPKLLFLDDEEYRHDLANSYYHGYDIYHAYSAGTAIYWLGKEKFDLISLDHDLGEKELDGKYVAEYIAKKVPEYRVAVHSMNPVGQKRIMDVLPLARLNHGLYHTVVIA